MTGLAPHSVVGQLIMMAKASAPPGAVRFYDDTGGLARPLFLPEGVSDAPEPTKQSHRQDTTPP